MLTPRRSYGIRDLIRDQGDRQLDTIAKVNRDKPRSIEFYSEKDKKLKDLVNRSKIGIKENRHKKFVHTTGSNKQYDFNQYRDLYSFGNEICNGESS